MHVLHGSDFDLSNALDVGHAAVERGDELVQMTELARSYPIEHPPYHWTSPVLRDPLRNTFDHVPIRPV